MNIAEVSNLMNAFLVLLSGKSQSGLDEELLINHITHLKRLKQSGNLLVCGPFVDDSGAMLVVQAESQEAAKNLIQNDPFIKESYYCDFSLTEFYLADEANNYLMNHDQTQHELDSKK